MSETITKRWIKSAADERAVREGCYFDEAAAVRVAEFFRRFLRHSKGEWGGKPFELLPWQYEDVFAPLFGWMRPDGFRRFRRAYIEIPKKNGKSTIGAGVGLYLLVGDREAGAEVYSVAADREQASIVHGEAIRMIEASPELSRRLKLNRATRAIHFAQTKSVYKALSSEANTKEGLNAHGLIIDELHAWKGRALWDALKYAGRARRQPLLFAITTAGDDVHALCREQHDYAKAVNRGEVEDTRYFGYIRAARQVSEGDEVDDDWTDPETWRRANPSMGATIREEDFAADVREAQKTPTTIAALKRYLLNIWSTSQSPWLCAASWGKCAGDLSDSMIAGRECWGGLDLAKTRDMTALSLCFPLPEVGEDCYGFKVWFWLPEARIEDPDCLPQWRIWHEQGFIEATPGDVCDYAFVRRRVRELAGRYQLKELAYDPWNAESTTQELQEQDGIERVAFHQTIGNFAEPTAEFERLVVSGKLRHDGNPVLAWQASHVQVKTDAAGNKRPVKPRHEDPRKIDGIAASVMALARAMKATKGGSVYESRGIEWL